MALDISLDVDGAKVNVFFVVYIRKKSNLLFFCLLNPIKKSVQSGRASWWRVCYQRGLTCAVWKRPLPFFKQISKTIGQSL